MNNLSLIYSKKDWLRFYNLFGIPEKVIRNKKGYLGTYYGCKCYLSEYIEQC